jgi:hypothetical protein
MRIVGDHPHRGESGTILEGSAVRVAGFFMFKVWLDDTTTAEACYAEPRQLRPLPRDEDPDGD